MRRLVITGLPCSAQAWNEFLGDETVEQRILPFIEVLKNTTSSDPRVMSRYVTEQISDFLPDSIVAHDLGVPLALLSLLRLSKRKPGYTPKVTLFNGVFRGFKLFKSPHVFKVQFFPYRRVVSQVEKIGGNVDRDLLPYLPRIRAIYRKMMVYGVAELLNEKLGVDNLLKLSEKLALKTPIQIIASEDDPYIPMESMERLCHDFSIQQFHHLKYGHFPYSLPKNEVLPILEVFEKTA